MKQKDNKIAFIDTSRMSNKQARKQVKEVMKLIKSYKLTGITPFFKLKKGKIVGYILLSEEQLEQTSYNKKVE